MTNTSGLMPPVKPGEVRNPEGNNQYTYRSKAEAAFEKMLLEAAASPGQTRLEVVIDKALAQAEAGKPYALDQILKRILPTVERHEHRVTPAPRSHEFIPDEAEQRALSNELKSNGADHSGGETVQ